MPQKRVTFKVAKALKEVGYPQNTTWWYSPDGNVGDVIPDPEDFAAPSYLDVWTWLSNKKHIFIDVKHHCTNCVEAYVETEICDKGLIFNEGNEEDGIAAAIDYLVNYDLIK